MPDPQVAIQNMNELESLSYVLGRTLYAMLDYYQPDELKRVLTVAVNNAMNVRLDAEEPDA